MNIIIADSNFESDLPEREVLSEIGFTLKRYHCITEEELIEAGKQTDAVLVQFAPVTKRVLICWEKCKLIVRYGIGYDNIDVQAAAELGIRVCNVPYYCLDEVADHTCSLILAGLRKLILFHQSVMNGKWDVVSIARPMPRFSDQVVGLIGFGRIGAKVAMRLKAFQFKLIAFDPFLSVKSLDQHEIQLVDSLEHLLQQADIISLHLPLTEQTRHLINEQTLKLMKSDALFVNASRGGLVDSLALAKALQNGIISGAALDVFEQEPLPNNHPLRDCKNVILTPHAAYYSEASLETLQVQAAKEIVRWYRGETLQSQVNSIK